MPSQNQIETKNSMSEKTKYICSSCGEEHEDWPALAFISPDNYNYLSDTDKKKLGYLDSDFCVIDYGDQTDRFIRCTLIQKVNDHCDNLNYGLWVSLSEKSYADYEHNFKKESEEKGYFGWLCNDIADYDFSESIPMDVITQGNGQRPQLMPHKSFDHPFVIDFYNGISKEEAERRISNMLERVAKNESVKKKWWGIWK